jgi:hypothetical protein
MCELDHRAQLDELSVHRGARRGHREPERLGGTMQQHGIAERFRRGGEDEQPGLLREQLQSPGVAVLDPAHHRLAGRDAEPAGELIRIPRSRQLEERERVAVALDEDVLVDARIERPVHVLEQQRARILIGEALDRQRGEPAKAVLAGAGAHGAHERDPLGEKSPGDEDEDLRRGVVEPLRVVDDADDRPLLGGLGEQGQRRKADQEAVGRGAGAQPEDRCQCVPLRDR